MLALFLILNCFGDDKGADLDLRSPSFSTRTGGDYFAFYPQKETTIIATIVGGKLTERGRLPFAACRVASCKTGFLFGDSQGQFHWTDETFKLLAKIDGVTSNEILAIYPKTDSLFLAVNTRSQLLLIDIESRRSRLIKNYAADRLLGGNIPLYNEHLGNLYLVNKEGISVDSNLGITNILRIDGESIANLYFCENGRSLNLATFSRGNHFGPTVEKSIRRFDAQSGKEAARWPILTPNDINQIVPATDSRFGAFTSKGKNLFFEIFKETDGRFLSESQVPMDPDKIRGWIVGFFYYRKPIYLLNARYIGNNHFLVAGLTPGIVGGP